MIGRARSVVAALALVAGISPEAGAQDCSERYAGVTVRVVEEAHDGLHAICDGKVVRVDANSDMVIEFVTPVSTGSTQASPESQRLLALLDRVRVLEREVARLNAAPSPTDSAGVAALQQEATDATTQVVELLGSLDSLGWSKARRDSILGGSFPGGTGDRRRGYANLNLWLDQELQRLRTEAEAFAAAKDQLLVQVEAFRDPRGAARSALHVENYDDLPAGKLQTIDRYGLDLTPAERAAWETSVAFHQNVAAALREIEQNRQSIVESIRGRIREVGERFQQVATMLSSGPDAWAGALAGHIKQIEALAADPDLAASKGSLQGLAASLRVLEKDYLSVRGVVDGASKISSTAAAGGADLRQVLFQDGGIVAQLSQLDAAVTAVVAGAADFPKHVEAVEDRIQELSQVLPTELATELLTAEVTSIFQKLAADLPTTAALVQDVLIRLGGSGSSVDAVGTLAPSAGSPLPRALDDLPAGRIELARAGWVPGDRVLVTVSFVDAAADPGAPGPRRPRHQFSYRGEAILTGLHRELSSALIFARALHGAGERTWKPNVAAIVGWHYYKRHPQSFAGRFWNWLNPGLGLHLASLDQAEDNFEFGVGGNLTVWNGLLSTGFGWNLSRENGEYVFLAIDLFETLNRVSR